MNDILRDKIYLSKLSIIKYREYYIELFKNIDFIIADYLENNLTNYQDIKFDNKKIFIRKEYLEKVSIVRLSIDLVKALERHFENLNIFQKLNTAASNKLKFNGDNNTSIDDTDGNRDEEKKFWENRIKTATKKISSTNKWDKIPANAKIVCEETRETNIDWIKELKEYLLIDTADYTFTPPDKRYGGGDLFLPAYNEVDEDLKIFYSYLIHHRL